MRIWVDCTAAAHPLVLRPLIERFTADGHEVVVTARSYGQTEGILDLLGIPYQSFGEHGGAGKVGKVTALAGRSAALYRWTRKQEFDLALAHGSVDASLVSRALGIPLAQMNDYEFAGRQRKIAFRAAALVLAPEAIPVPAMEAAGARPDRLFRYAGLKEDYYLADFEPDPELIPSLGIEGDPVVVVVRPPPETSEYHADNPLYEAVIQRLAGATGTVSVVIPRTDAQRERLNALAAPSLIVPDQAIDAQSLIAYADLVVSAGGTMNREAVALGTPVYTIFAGRMGAVDEELISEGRLEVLRDASEIDLRKREAPVGPLSPRDPGPLAEAILRIAR